VRKVTSDDMQRSVSSDSGVERPSSGWFQAVHGHDSDHIGVSLTAFGEANHEPGQAMALDLVLAQPELEARHSECRMQICELFAIESFWKHAIPLAKNRLLNASDLRKLTD
jgi:hypothetical protein